MPFQPGTSGNPAGKPRGTRHKATRAVDVLLEGEAEKLTRKAIELALEGDGTALRLCLERLCPPRKDRPIRLQIGPVVSLTDLSAVQVSLVQAMAQGHLTPAEAADAAAVVERVGLALERRDLETRLAAL